MTMTLMHLRMGGRSMCGVDGGAVDAVAQTVDAVAQTTCPTCLWKYIKLLAAELHEATERMQLVAGVAQRYARGEG